MFDPWSLQSREEHRQETGHAGWETSLTLCLFVGVQKGLHGWHPEETDRVATVYRCCECSVLLEDAPDGNVL